MKYFKSSMKYFWDKGPYLVLISIIPSLLVPFLLSPSSSLYYLCIYKDIDVTNFATLYAQMRALPYEFFYIGIAGLILAVFAISILFGVIDRHMRVGEFTVSFRKAKTRLNYNIITALKFLALVIVIFELHNLLTTALYYLWAVVFGKGVTWLVFSAITLLFSSIILLFVMSCIILWPTFMLHTGLKSVDAFKMAWRQISGKVTKVGLSFMPMVIPFQLVMIITGVLDCGVVVRTILDGVCYAIIIPYYITLMYVIFYDVTGTERMDLGKVNIWSKKVTKKKGKDISE